MFRDLLSQRLHIPDFSIPLTSLNFSPFYIPHLTISLISRNTDQSAYEIFSFSHRYASILDLLRHDDYNIISHAITYDSTLKLDCSTLNPISRPTIQPPQTVSETPPQGTVLALFSFKIIIIRKGETIELRNGDFSSRSPNHSTAHKPSLLPRFLVKTISQFRWPNHRTRTQSPLNRSAVHERVFTRRKGHASILVARIHELRMTNKTYQMLNHKHTMQWPPSSTLYRHERHPSYFRKRSYESIYSHQTQKTNAVSSRNVFVTHNPKTRTKNIGRRTPPIHELGTQGKSG